jgi:hypothetical protein
LRDHPNYEADWRRLASWSNDGLSAISTSLDGLASITRTADAARVLETLAAKGLAVVVGESGAGKSALIKAFIAPQYKRVVWLSCEELDATNATALQNALGLQHSFVETLGSARQPVLLVIDGAERLSSDASQFVARSIPALREAGTGLTHIAITVQAERLPALSEAFADGGVHAEPVMLEAPSEATIQEIARSIPALGWSALRPELRPALRNLKLFDWTLRAVRSGSVLDTSAILNVSQLIGLLWRRLPGDDGEGLERSRLLLELGIRDGDVLTGGVFRTSFDGRVLGDLVARGLVRLRNERVSFGHDMLGDWARLHVLLGEGPDAVAALRVRAARPRWHRAIRLYAQALLDLPEMRPQAWRAALTTCDDGTEAGVIVRDLLLEAVIVASNAADRISTLWPVLCDDSGRLLRALLERFLIVATVPDPHLAELFKGHDLRQLPLSCRVPFAPYWAGVLRALHLHRDDVAKWAGDLSATIASKWLSWTEPNRSAGVAWRQEAAQLAIALSREAHAQIEERDGVRSSEEVFQALLHAAPEAPDEVAALALELAQRRDLSPDIAMRKALAAARREGERRELERRGETKRLPAYLTRSILGEAPIRSPWPHGPTAGVDQAFANACRLPACIASLASVRPAAARELVLATTIEPPKAEDPHGYRARDDDYGLVYWLKGYPPFYSTGPWLRFLREAPTEALTTILQLVNFATERWEAGVVAYHFRDTGEQVRAPAIELDCASTRIRVVGDETVFQWHYRSSLGTGMLHSALMTLEKYTYELIEAGVDVSPMLERILREGRSLAFVGLLLDIGKHSQHLFGGVLRPLLEAWELYEVDAMKTMERTTGTPPWMMMPWAGEGSYMEQLASEWFSMPHRSVVLRDLVPRLLLTDATLAAFFERVRARWTTLLRDGQPQTLELLIARFDPANYPTRNADEFEWPAPIAQRLAPEMTEIYRNQLLMFLPIRALKWLSGEASLGDAELAGLWSFLQTLSAATSDDSEYSEIDPREPRDVMFAVIAAIVVTRPDWLAADPAREEWCRCALENGLLLAPPASWGNLPTDFDKGFDAFSAEAGVALLARNRADPLARQLVAHGLTSDRDNVIARVFRRAFPLRHALEGDFRRMQRLATATAAHRSAERQAKYLSRRAASRAPLDAERQAFVGATLDATATSVRDTPRRATGSRGGNGDKTGVPERNGELDRSVIRAAFGWLDLAAARDRDERGDWLALLEDMQALAFTRLEKVPRSSRIARPDIPDEFALWTMAATVRALGHVSDDVQKRLTTRYVELGSREHHWVESFLQRWIAEGATDLTTFGSLYDLFFERALSDRAWAPEGNRDYDVARIVRELFAFGLLGDPSMAVAGRAFVDARLRLYERAAARWFSLAPVLAGFLRFAVKPAASGLRLRAVAWVATALPQVDEDDWDRVALTEALATYLRVLWQDERVGLSVDASLKTAFERAMTVITARGSAVAAGLRDDILDSSA